MQHKNYYILLGVSNTASYEAIKAAYRHLAKKYHPDKNHDSKVAEEHFKEIQQAYAILSNPEKRSKYDLKNLYGNSYLRQKKNTQNAGTANQYAQQKAQQKKQEHTKRKTRNPERDKTEKNQVLVSIGIAFILLYFIISYNTNKKTETFPASKEDINQFPETQNKIKQEQTTVEKTWTPITNDFDSPYGNFFGEEIFNEGSLHNIIIKNSNESDAIVCLVENKKPNKTIRNRYINIGKSLKMNNIPDGEYFLKVYYGTDWDTAKTFINNKVKGGFKNEIGFVELNTDAKIIKMQRKETTSSTHFSSYEIAINPNQKKGVKIISAEQFFK